MVTELGRVRTVVRHGVTGLLAPSGDTTPVAASIRRLLDDSGLAERMSLVGRRHVFKRFGYHRLPTEIEQLYDEVVGSRP